MPAHVFHSYFAKIIHCCAKTYGAGYVRSSGFKLIRHAIVYRAFKTDVLYHVTSAHERRHSVQKVAPTVKASYASRAKHLVAGKYKEIRAYAFDIHRHMRHALRGIRQQKSAIVVRDFRYFFYIVNRTKNIGSMSNCYKL